MILSLQFSLFLRGERKGEGRRVVEEERDRADRDVKGVGIWMVGVGEGLEEEIWKTEGMRFGKYEMGRTLGEGKFGKVKYAKEENHRCF
ncbi:CBL-interacting serine/threonine-protein kinase 1 [Sarracenia purpurea var. burkii]